jgi:hypothetical protein
MAAMVHYAVMSLVAGRLDWPEIHATEDIPMSRWPLNGRMHKLVLIGIIFACCLLFSPAAATVTNVQLSVTPDDICADNNVTVTFHVFSGLNKNINGIYITFDENFIIDDSITTDCITIRNSSGVTDNPTTLEVIHNPDPVYSQFGFPDGTTTLKMTVPIDIQQNTNVVVNITCGLDVECPCDCSGYNVWANTDLEQLPVMSNTVYLKAHIEAYAGPNGSITPAGTQLFECCSNASYLISADPCFIIKNITVTPLCEGCGECYTLIPSTPFTQYQYNFTNIRCCYNITAYFTEKTCNVTAIPGPNGGILTPDGEWVYYPESSVRKFNCSEQQSYLIRPNVSYSIENITVGGNPIKFTPMENGSYILRYTSDCNDTIIRANFTHSPVDVFLKWRRTYEDCDTVDEYQVAGFNHISDAVEFSDSLYLSGNSSSFNITGMPGSANFGYYSGGLYYDGIVSGFGKTLEINVTSLPVSNPETYRITYLQGSVQRNATLTILTDGTVIWFNGAPPWTSQAPDNVNDIVSVQAQMPAWQMVTQDYLDHNPEWEGLVGAVVYVADGTYYEVFEVDTPGLHLKNFPGATPVIDANGNYVSSGDTASAVFLSAGCTGIEGFTITDSGANGIAVYPSSSKCADATILDWMDGQGNVMVPCMIGRVNIVGNTIFGNADNGIRALDCVVLILDNIIYGNVDDGIDAGCLYTGVECIDPEAITHDPAASEIIYNEIYGNGPSGNGEWEVEGHFTSDPTACGDLPGWTDSGIQIRCTGEGRQEINQTLYIVHNDVYENYHAGIFLMEDATSGSNITIQANHLIGNGIFGMLTEAEYPERIDFRWNDIFGNYYWGVKNLDEDDLIAKENYWGELGGPSEGPAPIDQCIDCRCHEQDQRSDALGNGDAVSHRIHYNPWLYVSSADIFHDGGNPQYLTRSYGSDSLLLQKGWNTLSVPCKLSEDADTIMEIETLGDFVTSQNAVVVYQWDSVSDMWVDIGPVSEKLIPGRGYYILMKEPSRFPVLYNNNPSPGLPSYGLEDGWNLIGAPWGIDREKDCCADDEGRWAVANPDINESESFKPVWEALESIKEGNGGTKGVAVVVSPSVPGQISIYSASVTSGFWDPILNNKEMATGEGYWVFMVNPGTYAGFEITPFYFT